MLHQWLRVFSPVTGREQEAWELDWDQAVRKLPYVKMLKHARSYALHNLVTHRCQMNFEGGNLSIAEADLERIWRDDLAAGLQSGHSVVKTAEGFEFIFAALTSKNTYITGCISMEARKRI